jgi:hypothetical protein
VTLAPAYITPCAVQHRGRGGASFPGREQRAAEGARGEARPQPISIGDEDDLEGFMSSDLSACNIAQARMLVGLFNRSFGVTHEKGRLQLCWKSRPLISVSVWTPV